MKIGCRACVGKLERSISEMVMGLLLYCTLEQEINTSITDK
jgi:hypothetical protein